MKKEDSIQEIKIQYNRPELCKMSQICHSDDANDIIRKFIREDQIDLKEYFWVILLSRSNHVLGIGKVGEGSTVGTVVNGKEIFQLTLKANAVGIILCHNHPSGNLEPSTADKLMTKKIADFAKMIDVAVIDHLIITSEGFYSFADENII